MTRHSVDDFKASAGEFAEAFKNDNAKPGN